MNQAIRPEKLLLFEQRKNRAIHMAKTTALNKIAKLYHPKFKFGYDNYGDESWSEQRESYISSVIDDMNKQIKEAKEKYKKLTTG